jgi:D-alanyl-lipoteichoic acid acyltransferase DltB (MBOAT superfamily)
VLFNSIEFAFFLLIVFLIYWQLKSSGRIQNLLLLAASYVFYGWWDWRFLILLASISTFNYLIGIKIETGRGDWHKKFYLIVGLVINLGVLGFFKYFNFFINGFIDLVALFGYQIQGVAIKVVLPLGISFYTFLSISYILDIYKDQISAERDYPDLLLALSFFPIILAGPIQRPSSLLPQIKSARKFEYTHAVDGMRQILWGLFVKIVIADNISPFVDQVFSNYPTLNGSTLFVGALFYTIQIYADFSGYSHIAIGTASLLGFRLMQNFKTPYYARDIVDFWKRWHISLTTWFRDYLFLPVSFSISWRIKTDKVLLIRTDLFIYIIASLLTWFLTGLWHGANYTFLIWGLLHGLMLILYRIQAKPRKRILKKLKITNDNIWLLITEGLLTFFFIVITWVIFRSESVHASFAYIQRMLSSSLFTSPGDLPLKEIVFAMLFLLAEFVKRHKSHPLQFNASDGLLIRWGIYVCLVVVILFFGGSARQFIYFQF